MEETAVRFDLYVKSLKGKGVHTFLIGGKEVTGAVLQAHPDYFELNARADGEPNGSVLVRVPYSAVQYVRESR